MSTFSRFPLRLHNQVFMPFEQLKHFRLRHRFVWPGQSRLQRGRQIIGRLSCFSRLRPQSGRGGGSCEGRMWEWGRRRRAPDPDHAFLCIVRLYDVQWRRWAAKWHFWGGSSGQGRWNGRRRGLRFSAERWWVMSGTFGDHAGAHFLSISPGEGLVSRPVFWKCKELKHFSARKCKFGKTKASVGKL